MKNILFLVFILSVQAFGQNTCKTGYFHQNRLLDSLDMPGQISKSVDSIVVVLNKDFEVKKKEIKSHSDAKAAKKKIANAKMVMNDSVTTFKRKLMQKFYATKIREASLKLYNKGKDYESVFNADSKYFSKIPENSCDITEKLLALIRESK